MKNSQFDAKTFGVGQLITQRKLFRVPAHQRSYSWEMEAVRSFLSDVQDARSERDSDYFIGLVVLLGPENGEWILLDGQQRLTTTSLVFAAIKYWLNSNHYPADAVQVDNEYLGVRRLGGGYSSRMQLNDENQAIFVSAVIDQKHTSELRDIARSLPKRSSNRLLLDAALACREWVELIAGNAKSSPERALFDLVSFLDARVKVVCVDVSSEIDAYILFESLNDRGMELSALDLIKNHIIGNNTQLESSWPILMEAIGDGNPDDFLKVFWTSRYGITQKSQIFRRVKEIYWDSESVATLMGELIEDANVLAALDDEDHPYWRDKPPGVKDQVFLVRQLGTKQVRPVVISALRNLSIDVVQQILWQVTVGVVRFQVVGKGRTGVVEKVFGRLCQALSRGDIHTSDDSRALLDDLLVLDEQFEAGFQSHMDSRYTRIAYLLAEISEYCTDPASPPWQRAHGVRKRIESTTLDVLIDPVREGVSADDPRLRLVGNYVLVGDEGRPDDHHALLVGGVDDIPVRSEQLARSAQSVWRA